MSLCCPDLGLQSQGLALKVSLDVTADCASLEPGCATIRMTAGTTPMSGTVVSRRCTQTYLLEIFCPKATKTH